MNNSNYFLNTSPGQEFVKNVGKFLTDHLSRDAYGFVGVFGTRELGHDIDLLFYPSGDRPIGEYLIAHMNFLKDIKEQLKYQGSDLIPFPMLELQDEVEYLSQRKLSEVFLHNLIFTDMRHVNERVPFLKELIDYKCETVHGTKESFENSYSTDKDFYYFTLVNSLVHLSNYPDELLSKKNKHLCSYVNKYALENQLFIGNPKTQEENLDLLYRALAGLDQSIN